MTRFLPLLIATRLFASPGVAAGFLFDFPELNFPQTDAAVTQSTSGQTAPPTVPVQD